MVMESVHGLNAFVAAWVCFWGCFQIKALLTFEKYILMLLNILIIWVWAEHQNDTDVLGDTDEGMTCLTAIILFSFILLFKMEWKYKWPGQIGAKIVKWGWVIWFLSVQCSVKKTECFIVCVLPTPLPKQSALLLLANMYLTNIYNFISYLAVLFNLSATVIRSKEFGRLRCHQETVKTATLNTAAENTPYLLI